MPALGVLADGWYLAKPPSDNHGLMQQSLEGALKCSWSGQSGKEKRDEDLLVRDISPGPLAAGSTLHDYGKRAKVFTYGPLVGTSHSEFTAFAGAVLVCVHDKRKYTRKASSSSPAAESRASAESVPQAAERLTDQVPATAGARPAVAPKRRSPPAVSITAVVASQIPRDTAVKLPPAQPPPRKKPRRRKQKQPPPPELVDGGPSPVFSPRGWAL